MSAPPALKTAMLHVKRISVETAFLLSATVFVVCSGDRLPQCYTLGGFSYLVMLLTMARNCSFHTRKLLKNEGEKL
jgi:hypothetical protein